jgi:putative restriction endonuclease
LRSHGWNGTVFHQREAAGYRIAAPSDPNHHLDRAALAWHFETKFRAA